MHAQPPIGLNGAHDIGSLPQCLLKTPGDMRSAAAGASLQGLAANHRTGKFGAYGRRITHHPDGAGGTDPVTRTAPGAPLGRSDEIVKGQPSGPGVPKP